MNNNTIARTLLFFLILTTGAYFYHPVQYDNASTRYFQTSSIVDYGTLNIDNYQKYTADKSYYDGHYYPNKAPGAQLLGVPVYWLIRTVKSDETIPPLTAFDKYIIRFITTTLPFAILGLVLLTIGTNWNTDPRKALYMVLAYAFGSIALQHATIFSGHQIAASFSFFSFSMVYSLSKEKSGNKAPYKYPLVAFTAGIFAGLAALSDYTAIYITIVLSIYTIFTNISKREKICFLLGGLICALLLAAYNYKCFGSLFTLSYGHQVTEQFKKGAETGIFGVSFPNPKVFFLLLFSPARGLFFIMPVFLFSIFGFFKLCKKAELRKEMMLILFIVIGYLLINSGFYGWHGGWIFGPRYLVPMLPFLAIPILYAPWDTKIFVLLLGISVFQVGVSVIGFPYTPEAIKNPVMEIILPCMQYGYFAKNFGNCLGLKGLWSLFPIFIFASFLIFILFRLTKRTDTVRKFSLVQRALCLIWFTIVIVILIFETTTPKKLVHENRGMLLQHMAITTKNRDLYKKAIYEIKSARESY